MCILPNTNSSEAVHVEQALHTRLREVNWQDELGIPVVTFSIGIACFPQDTQDKDHVLTLADDALYQAKAGGRNTTRFAQPI